MFTLIPFTVQQTVNDTNSTYFYCGTPGHCPKGMFGIMYVTQLARSSCTNQCFISNPPNAAMGSNTSLANMMPAMAANVRG